jgi:hypothetical protein
MKSYFASSRKEYGLVKRQPILEQTKIPRELFV